jgi:hypothetical protein
MTVAHNYGLIASSFPKVAHLFRFTPFYALRNNEFDITPDNLQLLAETFIGNNCTFSDFRAYKEARQSTSICWFAPGADQASCSCHDFSKRQVCGHSLAVDVMHDKFTLPDDIVALRIGQRRGPGRPRMAKNWKRDVVQSMSSSMIPKPPVDEYVEEYDPISDEESLQLSVSIPATPEQTYYAREHEQSPIRVSSTASTPLRGVRSSASAKAKVRIFC